MSDAIVINTGPLVALSQANALDVVRQLPVRLVTSEAVQREFLRGEELGHQLAAWPDWIAVLTLHEPLQPLATVGLDVGEASVIQLAIDQSINTVCIDEVQGRRCAKALGLKVTGSLGLLGMAKRLGLIDAVRPIVAAMSQHGTWFDQNLIARFLDELGE